MSADQIESVQSEGQGLTGTRQRVDAPSRPLERIYESLDSKSRDRLTELYDNGQTIDQICQTSSYRRDTVLHTLSCGFFNEGRIDDAERLARESLSERLCPDMHNQLLRCLLASPRDTRQEFFDESRRWAAAYEDTGSASHPDEFKNLAREGRPLSVGFLCDYLDTVFATSCLSPMFQHLGRHGLKVSVYDFHKNSGDVTAFYEWHRGTKELSTQGLYDAIQADGVNILFDLNGRLRDDNRYEVLFRRPAPIQVSYINLAATTGLRCIDYTIADATSVPEDNDPYYTETVYRMPCGVNGALSMPQSRVASMPCLAGAPFTFASFNASFKLNARVLAAWATILRRAPGSRLIIKNSDMARARMKQRVLGFFAEHGVQPNQLVLAGFSSVPRMYETYGLVDVALDTFPYAGASTALHALWQGVPVLTVKGKDWRGRMTTSILNSVGLHPFIVDSVEDYIETAVALTAQVPQLNDLRLTMREALRQSLYFDPDRFYVHLAAACRDMWDRWLVSNSMIRPAAS